MTARPNPTRVLILGGTAEAAALPRAMAEDARVAATTSLAGRTRAPAELTGAVRRGGFGGAQALADYLAARAVDLLVDAVAQKARTTALDVLDGETRVEVLIFDRRGGLVGRAEG